MANSLYVKGKEKILSGSINFATDTIKAALVSSAYGANLSTHEFLSDLGANTLGTNQALTGKSVALGVFDADDPTWVAVTAGATASCVVLYKDTGVAGTSPLLYYCDQITGFPLATNGGNITPEWDNGAYKIFSL